MNRQPYASESAVINLIGSAEEPDWYKDAICPQVDQSIFFPEKGGSTHEAKRVCAGCPVIQQCLNAALERGESHGVWGGMSYRERRKLMKDRAMDVDDSLNDEDIDDSFDDELDQIALSLRASASTADDDFDLDDDVEPSDADIFVDSDADYSL